MRMHADRDADRTVTARDRERLLARCEVLPTRKDAIDPRSRRAGDDDVDVRYELGVVEVCMRVDHTRVCYAVTRSRRGNSAGPVLIGSPGFRTPHRATSCQRAVSGAGTPSSAQIFVLTFGVYG